ncbi:kinase-like domain-containing protein [Glomus cerebriforme]|uniref:Kinase-like domain-containing protein n=1 Tax=Glomus cerebriforme TaxID=658196 RepID=A0A397TNF9_9GLOM|nr:kinase-like domain-containing protein [Glomus cerebriforme]
MEILNETFKEKPRNLWKGVNGCKYQNYVTISSTKSEEIDDKIIYIEDLEKRKEVYGICGECNEPGTGWSWCRLCNSKRFKENFKNWTSGNKDIDELLQHSQLNAVHYRNCLEWIPFENFQHVTYITRGGFGKIYSAEWPEGCVLYWDIENQKWHKYTNIKVALKSLDNSSDISTDFLNEIKSHLEIYLFDIIRCYGITQDPNTKDYMMVLKYCEDGNLRNYYLKNPEENDMKISILSSIADGLLGIHNAGKVHKDFHLGNILVHDGTVYISDLGMCQSANNEEQSTSNRVYGVLPYMAPEVLRGYQYIKAADIYSFGIIMNEYFSEEIPFNGVPHDHILAIKICKGLRPKISEDTPKLVADLIMKCWDVKAENRPTSKELSQILRKWNEEIYDNYDSEIYSQMEKYKKIRINKLKTRLGENKSENVKTHPQAIYTSRLLNYKNLPEPVSSSNPSSFQFNSDAIPSTSANPISECLDVQLTELDLNEIGEKENNVER